MRRSHSGVGGYRGRRTAGDILKWIAIVLAVLVGLVLAGLVFGQRYIHYTDSGIRVELPFGEQDRKPKKPVIDPDKLNVGEITDGEEDASQPEEKPDTPPAPAEEKTAALELPLSAILDGTAEEKLKAAGANTLVVEMKDREGRLNWVSAQPDALNSGVNSTVAGINEQLKQFNAGGVKTVARMTCFADNTAPYYKMAMGLRSGGGNWRGNDGGRWLDPLSDMAQGYLVGLIGELGELGFDEILLEYPACPTDREGNLASADFSGSDFEEKISGPQGFLSKAKAAAEAAGSRISVRTQPGVVTGELAGGGLTAQGLEQYVWRLWLPGGAQDMTGAGFTGGTDRVVEILPALEQKTEHNGAQLMG